MTKNHPFKDWGDVLYKDEIELRIHAAQTMIQSSRAFPSDKLLSLVGLAIETFAAKGKIAFVGNGGSAAEAIHLAAEFTGKCVNAHRPVSAICLNESQSAITAIGNDYGFEHVYSRQVEAHLKRGDLLIALSTSGRSQNILNALKTANTIGVKSILWMGEFDFDYSNLGVEVWKAPSTSTPRIQELHLMWGHILAEVVELHLD